MSAVQAKSGVYAIIHKDSGKRYIGSSKNFPQRLRFHFAHLRGETHFNDILQYAWNKYGEMAFERKPMLICSEQDRIFYEQLLIDGYKTTNRAFGYNLSLKAASPNHSEATRKKISEGVANARSQGKKVGNHKPHTEETKQKMREAKKGRPLLARRGILHTKETKNKISLAAKGRVPWNKGKKLSAEHIRKIKETNALLFKNIEFLEKWNAKKIIHCKQNHPLSGENLYTSPDGERICRICQSSRLKKYRLLHPRRKIL